MADLTKMASRKAPSTQLDLAVSENARRRSLEVDVIGLHAHAREAANQAYAPYSRLSVGAALLTASGEIIAGANVENASYGLTICAERIAIGRAVSEGHRRFQAIAIAITDEMNRVHTGVPCGACLQMLVEFAAEGELLVIFPEGAALQVNELSDLVPVRFRM